MHLTQGKDEQEGFFFKCFQFCLTSLLCVIAKGLAASYSLPAHVYGLIDLIAGQKIRILVISTKGRMTAGKGGCALCIAGFASHGVYNPIKKVIFSFKEVSKRTGLPSCVI